jgi:hypothetical protein
MATNSQPNLYSQTTGNAYMHGTPEYNAELARLEAAKVGPKNNIALLREELEGYTLEELIDYYHQSVDPDQTEDLVGLNEVDLIEKIIEFVQEQSGGKRRRRHSHSQNRKHKTHRRKSRKALKTRRNRNRKNRRN